jgi:hypothetical protein
MELREAGCQKCQRSSAGDCGDHGPKVIPATNQAPEQLSERYGGLLPGVEKGRIEFGDATFRPTPTPTKAEPSAIKAEPLGLDGPQVQLYHFICSTDPNHVVYVQAGHNMPPAPVICPWKCGWMNYSATIESRMPR